MTLKGKAGVVEEIIRHLEWMRDNWQRTLPVHISVRMPEQIERDAVVLRDIVRRIDLISSLVLPDDHILDCTDPSKVIERLEYMWYAGRREGEQKAVERFEHAQREKFLSWLTQKQDADGELD